jgi:hypothetical protein
MYTHLILHLLLLSCIFTPAAQHTAFETDHFFVLYDAGETNALMPVLQKFDREDRDFKVLVMGTAETIIKPEMFPTQRLVLKDFGVDVIIDNTHWQREQKLDSQDVQKICSQIAARTIIVGTASRVQRQVMKHYNGKKIAFCDNFDYDVTKLSYNTVKKTQKKAEIVLCPSKNLVCLFSEAPFSEKSKKYKIAGKPSLEQWAKELEAVDKSEVLEKLGFSPSKGPIVTLVGGYGPGYEIINPFFDEAAHFLRENGYQVLIQPHPKVAPQQVNTPEALAVSDYVVGFNSSVIFDAAIIGKKGIYFYPNSLEFNHFAIREGYLPKADSIAGLLQIIKDSEFQLPIDLYEIEKMPRNSTERIAKILNNQLKK